ncbi:lysine biosynthesis protein LysX [Sulfolobus sp. E1]|uniref:lysine biosynthesis protein LysX n=1 Tax=Saccharolobus sp. A20 TaxID=1891280 RepID=UPI0008461540|nr:lysine biosynthesis protein LysX [Sulfolobus sp. A20]TRM74817.1 lysine biosynthesis protein LysX [Sulfolobus sp. A20-N-F8]TRM78012.1 lysine biosynthesis protein LysX [Sulfolobus sp. B5]TRM82533.1 lysine biosynthesis protein LysX [Sulfolobus sp. D5]TRM87869.1 lysine biosynthesis protein LysX [Sulfolobus sp. C3]TRN01571.1 lysine biosynthesis protein LysX [Sulfolobus sp. F1]TRN01825.1 lysine biosynthesis protein LysX [Sulfolobus sp. E1]
MRIGLLYDILRWEEKNLVEESKKLGFKLYPLYTKDTVFFSNELKLNEDIDIFLQRNVSHNRALVTSFIIEQMGYHVINDYNNLILCENKIFTTYLLSKHNINVPKTYVAFNRISALEYAKKLGFPVVVKPVEGSWGRMVAKADNADTLYSYLEYQEFTNQKYKDIFYVQEFINKPNRDIRVFVIGDEVPVGIYRVNEGNWRTNTALGAKALPLKIDEEIREIALKVQKIVGGFFLGIDVFEDKERGYIVDEVNGVPEYKNTVRVNNFNLSEFLLKKIAEWVKR